MALWARLRLTLHAARIHPCMTGSGASSITLLAHQLPFVRASSKLSVSLAVHIRKVTTTDSIASTLPTTCSLIHKPHNSPSSQLQHVGRKAACRRRLRVLPDAREETERRPSRPLARRRERHAHPDTAAHERTTSSCDAADWAFRGGIRGAVQSGGQLHSLWIDGPIDK